MKAAVISFTGKGGRWNRVITDRLRSEDICCTGYGFYKYGEEGLEPFSHVRELMESLFPPVICFFLSEPQESP